MTDHDTPTRCLTEIRSIGPSARSTRRFVGLGQVEKDRRVSLRSQGRKRRLVLPTSVGDIRSAFDSLHPPS